MRPTILGLSLATWRGNNTTNTTNNTNNTSNNYSQQNNSSTPPRPLRQPLQARDHNARIMRTQQKGGPLSSRSGNATMPSYDKQNLHASNTARPVPALNAAAAKTVNKTPLTPRVAGPTAHSQSATPVARKTARPEGGAAAGPALNLPDISTPVSSFLSHNITPRSSSRKTRVESANTTPITTPNGTPGLEQNRLSNDVPTHAIGLGVDGFELSSPKRSTVTFSPAVSDVGSSRRDNSGDDNKFFYASDVKMGAQPTRQQKSHLQNKPSHFLYANGDSIPPPVSSGGSAVGLVTGSLMGEERSPPKFFHANGTPDLRPRPTHNFSATGSTASSASHITAPRLGTLSPQQRPTSPPKLDRSFPTLKTSLRPSPSLRPNTLGRGQTAQEISPVARVSTESYRKSSGHEKSASVGSLDLNPLPRRVSIVLPLAPASPSSSPILITAALSQSPELISSDKETGSGSQSATQSPIKTGQTLEQLNELAANARRERKVLDLEITNSSLAAINRTLEREMRKQTAELRRYRRLSRSGRLSIATSASRKSILVQVDEDGNPLSDLGEESEEEDDEDEISEDESLDDASLSPTAVAESDARHRKKDEKRLQLDLSKHQQLLVDSQKMNQSLKRCLGWTEELINEGKKALTYHVRVSDIELGGRVLTPDEEEEGEGNDEQKLSPIKASILSRAHARAAATGGWGVGENKTRVELQLDTGWNDPLEITMESKLEEVPP